MYPNQTNLYIIATACDNIRECLFDEDENDCENSSFTTPILISSLVGIIGIFIVLKICHSKKENKNIEAIKEDSYKNLIENLKANPQNEKNNKDLNTYLLHILVTKKTKITKQIVIELYDVLATLFNYEVAEVFSFMKKYLHQTVSKAIVEYKFRGLTTKANTFVEENLCSSSPHIEFNDSVTATPGLRKFLSTVGALASVLSHFADIVKDVTLCVTLLIISGGFAAIKDFPTNFSTAVVLSWAGTIFIPIFLSSVHLAITDPFLVFNSARLRAMRCGRVLAALGCLVLSPLNTVVLKTRLHLKEEDAVTSARFLGDETLDLYKECDEIESKLLEYLRHEIGRHLSNT